MNTKNIVLSFTIAGIITSSALMPMKRTWDDNDPTMQDHHLSKKTKTSDVVTMSDFFDSLPNETNDHIGQFLVPAHLDLTNPTHIKIIRTIVRYKNINRHFHHTIVPLCLRHIREITLSNAIITNQQKFNRFLAFLSQLINLNSISLSGTNITDQQLSALLDVVNRNKIKQLKLSFCSHLQNPTLNNFPALTTLYLSFCDNLQNPTLNNLPALTKLYLFLCPNLALVTLSTTMQHLHLEQQHPLIHFNYVNNQ